MMHPQYENVQAFDSDIVKSISVKCRNFHEDHSLHYHPEFEIALILESSGTQFIGDSISRYEPGDVILIGPNLPHCWFNDASNSNNERYSQMLVLQFEASLISDAVLSSPAVCHLKTMLDTANRGMKFHGTTAERAHRFMANVHRRVGLERVIYLLRLLHELSHSDLFTLLASPSYEPNEEIGTDQLKRIKFIHKYVHENIGDKISQTKIAGLVGLTASSFSRFFKEATGLSFSKYLNTVRIGRACRYLTEEGLNITDIAFVCGYRNLSNFNRRFMELKHMSPRQFRRDYAKLQPSTLARFDARREQ